MAEGSSDKERIIQELITHINSVEQKINMLKDELDEQNDLQTVNRLDIINLKNEMDRVRVSTPFISSDFAEKLKNMEKAMDKHEGGDKSKGLHSDIEQLKKQVGGIDAQGIERMGGDISALYDAINRMGSGQTGSGDIASLKKRIDELEAGKKERRCKRCGAPLPGAIKFCGKCGEKTK